jgi:phage regulator Rha-like protein
MEQLQFGDKLPEFNPEYVKLFRPMRTMAMQHSDIRHRRKVWARELQRRAHGHDIDGTDFSLQAQEWIKIYPLNRSEPDTAQ